MRFKSPIKTSRIIFIVLYLLLSGSAQALSLDVQKIRLSNGMTILILEDHSLPLVSVRTYYRVGSSYLWDNKSGLAHFIEHLMFRNTGKYKSGDIDRLTALAGGTNWAFTTYDFTCFTFDLPSRSVDLVFEIESDRMRNLSFEGKDFEAEKNVVLEEIKMAENDPDEVFADKFGDVAYSNSPYRYPVRGYNDEIKEATPQEVKAFYDFYYQPANAIMVLVGDIKKDTIVKKIEKYFGGIEGQIIPRPQREVPQSRTEGRYFEMRDPRVTGPVLGIAFNAPSEGDKDDIPFRMLDRFLVSGQGAKLEQELVEEKKVCDDISSDLYTTALPYIYLIRVRLADHQSRDIAYKIMNETLDKLKELKIDYRALQRIKKQMKVSLLFSFQKTSALADAIGTEEVITKNIYLSKYIAGIDKVTPEDIKRVAKKYLVNNEKTVGWLLP